MVCDWQCISGDKLIDKSKIRVAVYALDFSLFFTIRFLAGAKETFSKKLLPLVARHTKMYGCLVKRLAETSPAIFCLLC